MRSKTLAIRAVAACLALGVTAGPALGFGGVRNAVSLVWDGKQHCHWDHDN